MALVGGVDVAGQTHPEDGYGHRVVVQDPVPSHAPEPAALEGKQALTLMLSLKKIYDPAPDGVAVETGRKARITPTGGQI